MQMFEMFAKLTQSRVAKSFSVVAMQESDAIV